MKIAQINATCGVGSTGKICVDMSKLLTEKGIENYILYSQGSSDYPLGIKYMSEKEVKFQALKSRVFGNFGFNSRCATKKLIAHLNKINPDVVHLHNLHSHNCNLEMLFDYFRKTKVKIYWTFHDCWTITGYCTHFDMIGCNKWKSGCHNCVARKAYSWFFDNSSKLYCKKRDLFRGLDVTIITPSNWLCNLVKQSFLKDYPVNVINNGVNLDIFKPTQSNFKDENNINDKYVVLGVAFGWGEKKGLDCFIELAKRLPENYQLVLVGTNDEVDKQLPSNVISIHKTQNQTQLAEIYTAADVFVNCTREDTYPTVNMESLACGTPIITFQTGGSPEIIDSTCGVVVPKNDIDALEKEIRYLCENQVFSKENCLEKAKSFDERKKIEEYMVFYEKSNPIN